MKHALAWIALAVPGAQVCSSLCAQSFAASAGSSSLFQAQGATVAMYEGDRTTRFSGGFADGLKFGLSRVTQAGPRSILIGDSISSFPLPTDLFDAASTAMTRGITFRYETPKAGWSAFTGYASESVRTSFLSSQTPYQRLSAFTWHHSLPSHWTLSGVTMLRDGFSNIVSAARRFDTRALFAVSLGITEGSPVGRVSYSMRRESWRINVSESVGQWKFYHSQRQDDLRPMERSGLNLTGQKEFLRRFLLDAGRESFALTNPDGTRSMSQLQEAGLSAHLGHWIGSARGLRSTDGGNATNGRIFIGGWQTRSWQARASWMRTENQLSGASKSLVIDAQQRLTSRLRITQAATSTAGVWTLAAGGMYESRWGSISVEQHTVYVPFGAAAGLTRLTSISLRLHPFGNYSMAIDTITGGGLARVYTVSADSVFEGRDNVATTPHARMPRMGSYLIRGTVLTEDQVVVRGAAVQINGDTYYTDSEGIFEVRFNSDRPVLLSLAYEKFLTPLQYKVQTGVQAVVPGSEIAKKIELRVRSCSPCNMPQAPQGAELPEEREDAEPSKQESHSWPWMDVLRRELNLKGASY